MLNLILAIVLGGIFAWFALANSAPALVNLGGNMIYFPLYVIAFAALLFGITISALLSFTGWLSSTLELSNKDSQIRKEASVIADLKNDIQVLKLENAKLRGEHHELETEAKLDRDLAVERAKLDEREKQTHPSFFDRLKYRLAI